MIKNLCKAYKFIRIYVFTNKLTGQNICHANGAGEILAFYNFDKVCFSLNNQISSLILCYFFLLRGRRKHEKDSFNAILSSQMSKSDAYFLVTQGN